MFDMSIHLPAYDPAAYIKVQRMTIHIAEEGQSVLDVGIIKQHFELFNAIKHENENIAQNLHKGIHQFRRLIRLTKPEKIQHVKRKILIYANEAGDDIPTAIQNISAWEKEVTLHRQQFGLNSLGSIILRNFYDGCYQALEKNIQKLAILQHEISEYEAREIKLKIQKTMPYATDEQLQFINNHSNPLLVLDMVQESGYENMYQTLKNIRCKDLNVKKIEKRIEQLHAQWFEFKTLVDMQQLKIDKIDENIKKAANHTTKTQKKMTKTDTAQSESMSNFWKTILWVFLLLLLLGGMYWLYTKF